MTKPLLSIITGTVNRIDHLKVMMESVRRQIPPNISYDFVIADGGSQDGTLDYLRAQSDVVLIEQGRLIGAIKAFGEAFENAQGKYLFVSNDDIVVDDGILKSITYLESHPFCGMVAFADDRKAPGYEAEGYHVQTIRGIRNGVPVDVVYGQVCMVRADIAEEAGYWGHKDALMGETGTYGGDSYLSARMWEMGYTVDAVEGCQIQDRVASDHLRQYNYEVENQIGSAYYRRYPNGVIIPDVPAAPADPERLRILYCPLFSPGYGRYKCGLCDAFEEIGLVYELDYANRPRHEFLRAVEQWQPHLIFLQCHDTGRIDADTLLRARSLVPHAVVVNWCGDVYTANLLSADMLALLRHVDLQLVVNAEVLPKYAELGIHAAYWQIGFEDVTPLPTERSHEILFMANAYSDARRELGKFLKDTYGTRVGIYGTGWQHADGNTLYSFARGAALYQRCKIAISDNQYPESPAFVSNRLFEAMAHDAFVLQQYIPQLETYTGIMPRTHLVEWDTLADLQAKIDYFLEHEDERQQIAKTGQAFVREQFSFAAQVNKLLGLLKTL